jgi:hypothetical protein
VSSWDARTIPSVALPGMVSRDCCSSSAIRGMIQKRGAKLISLLIGHDYVDVGLAIGE